MLSAIDKEIYHRSLCEKMCIRDRGRGVLAFLVRTGPIPEPDMSGFEGSVSVHILDLKNIVRQWSLIIGKSVGSIWRLILGWRFLGGSMRDENTDVYKRQAKHDALLLDFFQAPCMRDSNVMKTFIRVSKALAGGLRC